MATLEQLLAAETQDQIKTRILAALNANGFPITDWESGAVMRTYVEMLALVHRDLVGNLIPQIAAGGFLDYAEDDWLTLLAAELYDLERTAATHTIQNVTLTCDAFNGPYNAIAVGSLIARSTSGRRYRNITGGNLPTSGSLVLQFQSESPMDSSRDETNYVDAPNKITELVTPLNGVTCNNPPTSFTPVRLAGTSTGTLAPSTGGIPVSNTYEIKILTNGQVGVATFAYKRVGVDADFVSAGVTSGVPFAIPSSNVSVAFANGSLNPSFIKDDVFTFASPGSPMTQQGRDEESDTALRERCRARWPGLSDVATDDKYVLWTKAADSQVTKVAIRPSDTVAGLVLVTIAGQSNPLDGSIVNAVQTYINLRDSITDLVNVQAASAVPVEVTGTVVVPVAKLAEVQTLAEAAWTAYIAAAPIGGTIRLSELVQALMDAGAVDHTGLAITGANAPIPPTTSPNVNLALASNQVAAAGTALASALTWIPV